MANFPPLKQYILQLIDELIDTHHLAGPFLDAGCGIGDISLHLAKRGWSGHGVDFSPEAIDIARASLKGYPVDFGTQDLFKVQGAYRTILLTTVLEHVKDDTALLQHLRTCFPLNGSTGHLLLSLPTNPKTEWRWDDEYYGHYRRYEKEALVRQLQQCGFKVLEFWDYTFPVYWAMRRIYTRFLPKKLPTRDMKELDSAESSMHSAWNLGKTSTIIGKIPIWPLLNKAQKSFRRGRAGFEAIVLAETI